MSNFFCLLKFKVYLLLILINFKITKKVYIDNKHYAKLGQDNVEKYDFSILGSVSKHG